MITINHQTEVLNRKRFLQNMGSGLASSAIPLPANTATINRGMHSSEAPTSIPRSPLNAPTEQSEAKFYPAPQNPKRRVGYAIVGLGHLALTDVMPAFGSCQYSRPVALVSGDRAKARTVAEQYGIDPRNIYDYSNFNSMADNEEIDAVYIILPNSMHHEFTIRAAKAGKHVLCEKPMANSVRECQEMIDACSQANLKLMIAYRIQYEPYNNMLQRWTRSKEYGNVKLMELYNGQHIGDPSQWRLNRALAGGGSLPDVGIYCLNTCRFLIGEEPESVFGSIYSTPGDAKFKEVEESVLFHLNFPSGVRASCITTYGAHMCRRYRAFTDAGAWFGLDPAFAYKGLQIEVSQAKGAMEWKQHPAMFEKDQFAVEIDHMSQCIINNKKPYTPGEEGLQDQRIIEAIYKSAREGSVTMLPKYTGLDIFRGEKPMSENG